MIYFHDTRPLKNKKETFSIYCVRVSGDCLRKNLLVKKMIARKVIVNLWMTVSTLEMSLSSRKSRRTLYVKVKKLALQIVKKYRDSAFPYLPLSNK